MCLKINSETRAELLRASIRCNALVAGCITQAAAARERFRIALEDVFGTDRVAEAEAEYGTVGLCSCGEGLLEVALPGEPGLCHCCFVELGYEE